MKTTAAPHILEATAALLSEDRHLSNAELLQRLTLRFGAEEMRAILVTRFQRQVREPALRLLQSRLWGGPAKNGDGGKQSPSRELGAGPAAGAAREEAAGTSAAEAPAPDREPSSGATGEETRRNGADGRRQKRSVEPRRLRAVDAALERAFRLGAGAESPAEIVEAFRQLENLRADVRRSLEGSD